MPVKPGYRHGFSLIQASLLLAVAGILMVSVLPGGDRTGDAAKSALTQQRMHAIEDAMKSFMAVNLRRPCPADATAALNSGSFGTEAANPGACTGGSPAVNFSGGGLPDTVAGGVPTRALHLPDEYAFDGWNRRLMYVVDRNATAASACQDMQVISAQGALPIYNEVNAAAALDHVMWALMSYGKDGHGSYSMQGSSSRMNTENTDVNTLNNAFVDAVFSTTITGYLVRKDPTSTFDDIVWYAEPTKNICCLGKDCMAGFSAGLDDGAGGGTPDPAAGVNIVTGDINGNGIKDLIIGNAAQDPMLVYVVFGKKTGWPVNAPLDMTDIVTNSLQGFVISNDSGITGFGRTLATGDVNGDGYEDIIIGGSQITIVFGAASFGGNITTSELNGVNGLLVSYGFAGGGAVPGAVTSGDLDGDGYKEVVFAQASGNAVNNLWVLWGRNAAGWCTAVGVCDGASLPKTWTITNIAEADGFKIAGDSAPTPCGLGGALSCYYFSPANTLFSLASGNVDGTDQYEDLVIGGAMGTGGCGAGLDGVNKGHVYVLFGRTRANWNTAIADGPPDTYTLKTADITARTLAKFCAGAGNVLLNTAENAFGNVVAVADYDNDGYKDLFMGGERMVRIYKGRANASWSNATAGLNLTLTNTNARVWFCVNGVSLPGWIDFDCSNSAVSTPLPAAMTVADITGNGLPELLIGVGASAAPDGCDKGANAGGVYVVGQGSGFTGNKALFTGDDNDGCDASEINSTNYPGTFRIDGVAAGDYAYIPAVGDINGDGKDDIIIGATMAGANNEGALYVLWGRRIVPWDPLHDLADMPATVNVDLSGL